jgi:phosphatidylserine decarboxylase
MIRFHKEGNAIIGITLTILFALNYVVSLVTIKEWLICSVLGISIIFLALVLQFFRNPKRAVVLNENHIIAPADGKVVVIEETVETEYYKDKRIQVSIFMSPLNVHVNRYPLSGEVKYAKYHPGKFLVAWHPKSSTENERTTVVVENNKLSVLFRQIAGAVAKRIVMYSKEGDTAVQGDDFGFIKFGSRVDLFLPLNARIDVQINEKVKGNQTIIASI